MRLVSGDDEDLVELLRSRVSEAARRDPSVVLARAERHGLGAVVQAVLERAGVVLPSSLATELRHRALARELDHAARLAELRRIDAAFADAGLEGALLKGPLFAERFYEIPSGRATSDTDLLVRESDLERATRVLEGLGYEPATGPEEERFRREHHHLHLAHAARPSLELHFHAYRGFGSVLPSEPLIERRERFPTLERGALGVLAKPDELVYLAVHAAGHRFVRLGWLYDIRLLAERMTESELELAAERARGWGYARILAFTVELVAETLGVAERASRKVGRLGAARSRLVHAIVREPEAPLKRAATRFVYSLALCDTPASAARYAVSATLSRARREA